MPTSSKKVKRAHHAGIVATSTLKARITEELKARIVATATRSGMTLSAFVLWALKMECDRQAGYPDKKTPFFIDPRDEAQHPIIVKEEEK